MSIATGTVWMRACAVCGAQEYPHDHFDPDFGTNVRQVNPNLGRILCMVCGGTGAAIGDYGAEAGGWCESCEGQGHIGTVPAAAEDGKETRP